MRNVRILHHWYKLPIYAVPTAAMSSAPRRVTGEWEMGGQYHFTMEPQTVRVIPNEDGQLDIHSATQGIKHVVDVVSDVVNIPANK